jgi:hypothetical protein
VIVHLVDGTYELFRHFYGLRRFHKTDPPFGAVLGVLRTVAQMLEGGATHIGVATDHVIESFRNGLWPDYKTGQGMEPVLYSQFIPLEESLEAMGVATWPMVELEAGVCPVGIRVMVVEVIPHRFRNAPRHLSPAGPVEVGDGLAVVRALESREVSPDLGGRRNLGANHLSSVSNSNQLFGSRRRGGA